MARADRAGMVAVRIQNSGVSEELVFVISPLPCSDLQNYGTKKSYVWEGRGNK